MIFPDRGNGAGSEPVIKWSGSKRSVAPLLSRLFPPAERFIDPFVGGGAILPFRSARASLAADVVPELIELWKLIQEQPALVARQYENRWQRLKQEGHTAYYDIRHRFNRQRDPFDFLFLSRTCVNGLIRFNSQGDFNNSLHHTRSGIMPSRLAKIAESWSIALQGVVFQTTDYRETLSTAAQSDFVFLDPPYAGTRGRYRPGIFDVKEFFKELDRLNSAGVRWILTFDGSAGDRIYQGGLPESLYRHHLAMHTGNSPFCKVMDKNVESITESVYMNFDPAPAVLDLFPVPLPGD